MGSPDKPAVDGDAAVGTRGDRTRRAILAAARERFAAHGFEETTLVDVAADAGVSGPTVAFHFGSKMGLLRAVVDDYYEDLVRRGEAVVDEPSSPMDRLVAFARFWLRAIDGDFDLFGVFFGQGGFRDTDSETGVALRGNNARVTRLFERLVDDLKADGTLRDDVSTRLVRDAFFGTAEHVLRGRLHGRRRLDHRRAADEILALVLRGAAVTPSRATATAADRLTAIETKLDALLSRATG
ncbi:MAG TPA: TetR/AcrR family transcriptional regulator [Solirubrobacteraceae bacterium]|jgi:AcrR family transcriptional regulator|nr:TetR/AcrR family transcriptional regulator [Solirubrobacteraceae bacterium]